MKMALFKIIGIGGYIQIAMATLIAKLLFALGLLDEIQDDYFVYAYSFENEKCTAR